MKQLQPQIIQLFQSFITEEISKEELISELYSIERSLGATMKKDLWFKFSEDDTSATDIRDLNEDLETRINRDYRIDSLKSVVENPENLRIFYSSWT